ncbi:MAG TPA: ABC transporter permease subunit [Micromonosporaceae bacterium]|nr:ABC transporter permease subunit [Micromonosporaceae bacterium]
MQVWATPRSTGVGGQIGKIILLGLVAAIAFWGAFPLVEARAWVALGILVAVTALIFYTYLSGRHVPVKYLLPGTLFLIAFQVLPVLYTVSTAFTNFGDGHRGTKQDAIVAIQTSSVTQVPGSTEYGLTVATTGDTATGPLVFLLVAPDGAVFVGDADGLEPLAAGEVTVSAGRVTRAAGYTVLNLGQASARGAELTQFGVPTENGAIRASGVSRAYEGQAARRYDRSCDCVIEAATGQRWVADPEAGSFVNSAGERLPQGWRVNVGLANFTRVASDPAVAGPFFATLVWNFAFAIGSVLVTFALGLGCALALHSTRVRGRNIYRVLLVLPYAMPSFAMLLVWRDMFNVDFGLINRLFDINVDWLGSAWTARVAVILVQLWLGYPYMFLVSTGALQAIPAEMTEAAEMDGAGPWQRFRAVTLPLLLVALSPLLIASFAFNFNNFNAIYLTTEGGPFPADNPSVGATDLLITYTYRLAFGGSGAQYGFAAAISFYVFLIVAIISAISFRSTRRQEEVYG